MPRVSTDIVRGEMPIVRVRNRVRVGVGVRVRVRVRGEMPA